MEHCILLTGIGGQGIQLVAKTLAVAATDEARFVLLNGAYGGEIRGGKSMATLHVGDEPLHGLPVAASARSAVVLHHRFFEQPRSRLDVRALLVVDAEIAGDLPRAEAGQQLVALPASDIARDIGPPLVAGMALIASFNAITGLVEHTSLVGAMQRLVPAHRATHIEANVRAMDAGRDAARGLSHPLALAPAGVAA